MIFANIHIIIIFIMMGNCDRVFHLKRDGGAPGDVSESHSKEEANVYLVSETA